MKLPILLSLLSLATMFGVNAQTRRAVSGAVAVVRHQNHPTSIAVDDANIYWVSDAGSTIKKLSKSAGAATTIVTGQKDILKIIVDGDSIYFITRDRIGRLNKKGESLPPQSTRNVAMSFRELPMMAYSPDFNR